MTVNDCVYRVAEEEDVVMTTVDVRVSKFSDALKLSKHNWVKRNGYYEVAVLVPMNKKRKGEEK